MTAEEAAARLSEHFGEITVERVEYELNGSDDVKALLEEALARRAAGKSARVVFMDDEKAPKSRTLTQNRALHKYLKMLSDALNASGYDQRKVMKAEAEIPWNEWSAKENLWRPIQRAMFGHESTTEPEPGQYGEIYKVLDRHLASKTGVSVPWPCKEQMMIDNEVKR